MINLYDSHRFISKKTLAELADVSPRTFARYLKTRRHVLEAMGVSPQTQKLPPQAVQYICEDYCIDLPSEFQDRKALEYSTIYQRLIHALQDSHLEKRLEEIAKKQPKSDKV
jgi:hypothetical protein